MEHSFKGVFFCWGVDKFYGNLRAVVDIITLGRETHFLAYFFNFNNMWTWILVVVVVVAVLVWWMKKKGKKSSGGMPMGGQPMGGGQM